MKIKNIEREKEILLSHIRIDSNGCWNWTGSKSAEGYGNTIIGSRTDKSRKSAKAHRVSFFVFCGEDPDGFDVCHKCDNPSCINPEHLFLGTEKDNVRDMYEKGRQAHLCGESVPSSKLTEEQVIKARKMRENGASYYSMAKAFGVWRGTIRNAVLGITWKSANYQLRTKPEGTK